MYTTMDCDFFEIEYYYSIHLRNQGESLSEGRTDERDSLSWLCGPVLPGGPDVVLTESVCNTTEPSPEAMMQPDEPEPPIQETPTSEVLEVRNPLGELSIENTNDSNRTDPAPETTPEEVERYVLPPRRNRGVPPKRYSPEREPRTSRYPVANLARERGSEEERAYALALYTEEIPRRCRQRWRP